jgi:hypothetical protein
MSSKKKVVIKKKAAPAKGVRGSVGKTTELSVVKFWEHLFSKIAPKEKLNDEQLAAVAHKEFPGGKAYTEVDVRNHRAMYNRGALACQTEKPGTKCPQYADGEALPLWGERSAAKKAAAAPEAETPAPAKKKRVRVRVAKK